MRLLTVYLPRMPAYATAECRSCRFATTATSGRTVCRSLLLDVRPDWLCRDYQPGGDGQAVVELRDCVPA